MARLGARGQVKYNLVINVSVVAEGKVEAGVAGELSEIMGR